MSTSDLCAALLRHKNIGVTDPEVDPEEFCEVWGIEVRAAEHACAYCGQDEVEYRYREKPGWWDDADAGDEWDPRWDRWYSACGWVAGLPAERIDGHE